MKRRAKQIKVLKEFTCDKFGPHFVCQIKEGEIGEYFAHTDVYCFEARNGYVPYVDGLAGMRNNIHFQKLEGK